MKHQLWGRASARPRLAPVRRAGVPRLPALRLAGRRVREVPLCGVRHGSLGGVLVQGARLLSELWRPPDGRAGRAPGRSRLPRRAAAAAVRHGPECQATTSRRSIPAGDCAQRAAAHLRCVRGCVRPSADRRASHNGDSVNVGRPLMFPIVARAMVYTSLVCIHMQRGRDMNKRLNITLPQQTVRLMDRVAGKGRRSSLIDRAVRRFVKEETRANLRKQLAKSYQANASFDLQLAEEWFPVEQEAWEHRNR